MESNVREILKKDFGETDRNDWAALVNYAKTALSFSVCNCYEGAAEVYPILKKHFQKIDEMAKAKSKQNAEIETAIESNVESTIETNIEKKISIDPKFAGMNFSGKIDGKNISFSYSDLISEKVNQETIKKALDAFPVWAKFFIFE